VVWGTTTTADGSGSSFRRFFSSFLRWQSSSQLFEPPEESCPDELCPLESPPDESSPEELPEELLLPDELLPDELHPVMSGSHANACGLPNNVKETKRTAVAPSIRAIFIVPPEDSRHTHRFARWSDTVRSILSIGNGRGNAEW
jgi:hypothetical protein